MRKLVTLWSLLAALLSFSLLASAQTTSSVTGTVSDSTGAVIPGASVTLTNTGTGAKATQTTDNRGEYHFFGLPVGSGYKAEATHEGFAPATFPDITLSVGQTRTLNITLQPAGAMTTTEVTANSQDVTLNTTDAQIGSSMTVEQLGQLPIYDRTRGVANLFRLQPGVDYQTGSVSGARVDQSSVTVDGLDVNDIAAGGAFSMTNPAPVDSLEQFNGTIAGLTSNIGTGSGGQMQLVTKSGTNKFHGSINEYHRDTQMVANPWFNNFNNINGSRRTPLIRNQFGGNVGGPVLRNRLFFFFDYAGSRIVQSSTATREVPNATMRNGELNYVNSVSGCTASATLASKPECITKLTSGEIAALDPTGQGYNPNILSFLKQRYPEPNNLAGGRGVNTAGYNFTYPTGQNQDTYVARVDYHINDSQKLYGRFTINRTTILNYPTAPQFDVDPIAHKEFDKSYSWVISHIWSIGSNKVNQFYFGDNIQKIQFPNLFDQTPGLSYSFTGFNAPYASASAQQRRIPIPIVRDDFNWQVGTHSLIFGGLFKWIKTSSLLVNDFNFVSLGAAGTNFSSGLRSDPKAYPTAEGDPTHTINASATARQNYANYLLDELGVIGSISRNFNYDNTGAALAPESGSSRNYRYYQFEGYFGDTWKITPKLTMSYGVRYQMDTSPYEVNGNESIPTWIPFNDFVDLREQVAQSGNTAPDALPFYSWQLGGPKNNGPNYFDTPKKDFGPRVAFAWSPFDSGKTVFNVSAGIDFDRTVINTVNFLQDQISFLFSNSNLNTFGPSLASAPRVGASLAYSDSLNPAPLPISSPYTPFVEDGVPNGIVDYQGGFVISKDLKDPYSIALNAGVQQELPEHFILKINYVGRLGRRLLADADANQILDSPDFVGHSQQSMIQAFADLTQQMRDEKEDFTPEPWFENVLGDVGSQFGYPSNTALVADVGGSTLYNGGIADVIVAMNTVKQQYGVEEAWPTNVGMPGQFASNAYLTNMGSSNYHAALVTINRNYANGLRFDVNYTWSHSIDNNSQEANNNALYNTSGILCDIKQPRACRGNSDFDVRHQINANFIYELPFGRKRAFASNSSRWLDAVIGGWNLSGIPVWRTGTTVNVLSGAYIASDFSLAAATWHGTNRGDLKTQVNLDSANHQIYMFKGGKAGADKVWSQFSGPVGLQFGPRNFLRSPNAFFFDAGLQKTFGILTDNKLNLVFRGDAFNVLNHPVFSPGAVSIVNNASNFGQITGTQSGLSQQARVLQVSLRLDF